MVIEKTSMITEKTSEISRLCFSLKKNIDLIFHFYDVDKYYKDVLNEDIDTIIDIIQEFRHIGD